MEHAAVSFLVELARTFDIQADVLFQSLWDAVDVSLVVLESKPYLTVEVPLLASKRLLLIRCWSTGVLSIQPSLSRF